jgi:hypothetical protein
VILHYPGCTRVVHRLTPLPHCSCLQTWVGTPAIYVFDCSAAGQILFSFRVSPR